MVTVVVVAIGFYIMLGKTDAAEKGLRVLVGLVVVLSFLPGMLAELEEHPENTEFGCSAIDDPLPWLGDVVFVVLLAGLGVCYWRFRSIFSRRREDDAKRWGSPRERATPPPPPEDGNDDEKGDLP